jgi:hypothetical protein
MKNFVTLAVPVTAVVAYFIFGQPLWATTGLGVFIFIGFFIPSWRAALGLSRVISPSVC